MTNTLFSFFILISDQDAKEKKESNFRGPKKRDQKNFEKMFH